MFLCKLCLMCGSVGVGGGKHGSMLALLGVGFFVSYELFCFIFFFCLGVLVPLRYFYCCIF